MTLFNSIPAPRRLPIGFAGKFGRALIFSILFASTLALLIAAHHVGVLNDWRQVQSLAIFSGVIWGILLYEDHRLFIGVLAVSTILSLRLYSSPAQFVDAAGLDVILFLLGTFLVAGYLEDALFFEHVASQIVRHAGRKAETLLGLLMLSAMIASAIVGEVAAILFVGGAMLQIARRYRVDPIPFLIMMVFATNVGSAASSFGPVSVTIALKAGLTVLNFFRWATPIALAVLGLVFAICRWYFARDWKALGDAITKENANPAISDPTHRSTLPGWLLVIAMTALFVFHAQLEQLLGIGPNVVLFTAALGAGGVALLFSGPDAKNVIQHRVDWSTLGFFATLFLVVGAMQVTGVPAVAARQIMRLAGDHPAALVLSVGWCAGLLSAFLANILAVAAFLPIVAELKSHGAACPTAVYWLMLFGATFMGNMTSIGSTCNIIACGMADKRGHGTIYFRSWLKIGILVSLSSMALATILLAVQTDGLTKK